MTIVCGDSHTSTHGAFGALAFGIGTSEVEHVLATQTLIQKQAKNMPVPVDGQLPRGVTAKDVILAIIGKIGTAGGTGHVIEYAVEAIRRLSMEGRMTVCNMSIEGGARAGMIAPDETTFAYVEGEPHAPQGAAWDQALDDWKTLPTDEGAKFDEVVVLDAAKLPPMSPGVHRRRSSPRCSAWSGSGRVRRREQRNSAARARLYGPEARHEDDRHHGRHRLHRLLHQ